MKGKFKLHRHFSANQVEIEPFLFRRELSMEAYLIENENLLSLDEELCDVTIIQEELTLKQGRSSIGTDGRIDILITYGTEYIGVVELKIGELNNDHLKQLEDYLKEKNSIFGGENIIDPKICPEPKWIGVLVGTSIAPELQKMLSDGYMDSFGTPIAALTMQRYRGKLGDVYVTVDVHYKSPQNTKDKTRYSFQDNIYGKGRLVLAVMKAYVSNNPSASFAEIEKKFPILLQGKIGVFSSEEEAHSIYENTGRFRHFIKPEELLETENGTIAVCNQWGIGNIHQFIDNARQLGYTINEISS